MGSVGGIAFLIVVLAIVKSAVGVVQRKKKYLTTKSHNSSSNNYESRYSIGANGLYHTSSATPTLKKDVHIDTTDSHDNAMNNPCYISVAPTFTPTPLTSPEPSVYDLPQSTVSNLNVKSAPTRTTPEIPLARNTPHASNESTNKYPHSILVPDRTSASLKKSPLMLLPTKPNGAQIVPVADPSDSVKPTLQLHPAPMTPFKKEKPSTSAPHLRVAPSAPPKMKKPLTPSNLNSMPASKPSTAPKPSASEVKRVPVLRPKPKLKPLAPSEKPALEQNEVVPPKHTVKPFGLDNGAKKPLTRKNRHE